MSPPSAMLSSALRSFKDAFEIQGELGRMVDEATADSLRAVDWGLNMHICDRVNKGQPDDIKDALRALSKRLRPAGVGVGPQMLALTLLEALVKHCGPELHLQVATREFMGDLKTLAEPGRADGRVSRKVLQLIHAWGEAFKDMRREMPVFYDTLLDLRAKGLSFPPFDASLAPNFLRSHTGDSPPATAGGRHASREADGGARVVAEGRNTTVGGVGGGNQAMHGPRGVAVFDVELLKNDLEQVNAEVNLLVDMVSSADDDGNSGTAGMDTTAQREARTLINELHRNVQIFQARVVALIEQVPESAQEAVIPLLLQSNEEILRALELYTEWDDKKAIATSAQPATKGALKSSLKSSTPKGALRQSPQAPSAGANDGSALEPPGPATAAKGVVASAEQQHDDDDLALLLGASAKAAQVIAATPIALPPPPPPLAPPPAPRTVCPPQALHCATPADMGAEPAAPTEGLDDEEEDDLAALLGAVTMAKTAPAARGMSAVVADGWGDDGLEHSGAGSVTRTDAGPAEGLSHSEAEVPGSALADMLGSAGGFTVAVDGADERVEVPVPKQLAGAGDVAASAAGAVAAHELGDLPCLDQDKDAAVPALLPPPAPARCKPAAGGDLIDL